MQRCREQFPHLHLQSCSLLHAQDELALQHGSPAHQVQGRAHAHVVIELIWVDVVRVLVHHAAHTRDGAVLTGPAGDAGVRPEIIAETIQMVSEVAREGTF